MDYLPVSLRLRGEPVVLIGAGSVATRKARLLLAAGAELTVVAPDITQELETLLTERGGQWRNRRYREADLHGKVLVVAATSDRAVNRAVSAHARALHLPVNVVDAPQLCTFIFPAIVDRSPLSIAISSGGRSPVLTRMLRGKIESLVPASYGALAVFAGRMRDTVTRRMALPSPRRRFWETVLEGAVGEQVLTGNEERAAQLLLQQLSDAASDEAGERAGGEGTGTIGAIGEVYLVGAGPGDPDLMTFKAMRALQSADVVLYDRLVAPAIVAMARRDAEQIYVGKARANHALPQRQINQLLVELALQGKRVVRLKGGDPFIFGRGGEEIELLADHNIPFQVVPGITAASGAACYAGIPLTHRDYAQSVRFVTGHLKDGELTHDWRQFLSPTETLVFYMGLLGLPSICRQLQAYGRAPDTPIALVERATTREQRVLRGTLATMEAIVAREQPAAPTLIIVGDVVKLHRDLAWFRVS